MGWILVILLLLSAPALALDQTRTIDIDGSQRTYCLFEPDNLIPKTVVFLHGWGGDCRSPAANQWRNKARVEGFRLIAPNAVGRDWNAETDGPDVELFRALADSVWPDPVYLVGFSDGGYMVWHLSCLAAEHIAGIAVVAGAFSSSECRGRFTAKPVIVLHSVNDPLVPWLPNIATGNLGGAIPFMGQAWRNGCQLVVTEWGALNGYEYVDCLEPAASRLYKCGHGWPGVWTFWGWLVGMNCLPGFKGEDVIWEFFNG